ncbi:hypothetical protein GWI34_34585 [Actinomadura sp. DSM 109109]|nr:hypothetical protein [Actinomadura lepetitiana]
MAFMDQIIGSVADAQLDHGLKAPVDLVHSRRLLMRALSTHPVASRDVVGRLAARLGWRVPGDRPHLGTFVPAAAWAGGGRLERSVFAETALEPLR